MAEIAVSLQNINKSFGSLQVLRNFTLDVREGEFVSLLGPSGCGKTTVLRIIAGFEQPEEGTVLINGKDVSKIPPEKRNIGLVFQNYALFPNMNVWRNIAFPMIIARKPRSEIERKIKQLLSMVKLEEKGHRYIWQLSGGERQRVALARALAREPKVLLLDEPLSALDAKIREELRLEIRRIQRELGITTIYVSHDQEEVLAISDRVVVMQNGVIQQVGSPSEIYFMPKTRFVANFVGNINLLEGEVVAGNIFLWQGRKLILNERVSVVTGEKALLAVRPERISICKDKKEVPAGVNVIEGQVQLTTFLGSQVRIILTIDNGIELKVDLPSQLGTDFFPGERVTAFFPPDVATLITD
ncbi:putative spermidine/putrescine transport system ATP-binding protein [Thermanaeromonas toyohensis ToBE]|uniref:ABC-type quaternary amine transporter n=1 Tax=Thermanaeromonas toyohensis ToBE TaxID=698762 RepID=A0A1W1VXV4_9FIRM|nr:ABC transporter ATP-binding protein [Thermanaeromonas toyohensis]SMB98185.1 putative spermidine/putrescine transport system ATP-binding protein [Thermanaeromonas toyohensis ToBE]